MLPIFERLYRFISANELLPTGARVLVAYSAGADSTFLVRALMELSRVRRANWHIELAHFNHEIDEEDRKLESLVQRSAERWKLPLHLRAGKLKTPTGKPFASLQAAARKQRYRFLLDVAREHSLPCVATAHQLDDQAETVLMRTLGGSWLTALAGIPLKRPLAHGAQDIAVVRPLLETTHADIIAALAELDEEYHDDPSNDETSYTRNNVRHTLMPLIVSDFNTGAREHLAALARQASELDEELTKRARRLMPPPQEDDRARWIDIPIAVLAYEPRLQQRYILREAMLELDASPRDVTYRRVESALHVAEQERASLTIQLTGSLTVAVHGKTLRLFNQRAAESKPSFDECELLSVAAGVWQAELQGTLFKGMSAELLGARPGAAEKLLGERKPLTEYLDAAKVTFPLTVRARRKGDRFIPLGMKKEKKLQDYLVDRKVKRELRDLVPLVCDTGGILWVVGQGISARARVTDKTEQVLRLSASLSETTEFPAKFELESENDQG